VYSDHSLNRRHKWLTGPSLFGRNSTLSLGRAVSIKDDIWARRLDDGPCRQHSSDPSFSDRSKG